MIFWCEPGVICGLWPHKVHLSFSSVKSLVCVRWWDREFPDGGTRVVLLPVNTGLKRHYPRFSRRVRRRQLRLVDSRRAAEFHQRRSIGRLEWFSWIGARP